MQTNDRSESLQQPYLKGLVLALLLTGVLYGNDYNGGVFILEFDG